MPDRKSLLKDPVSLERMERFRKEEVWERSERRERTEPRVLPGGVLAR